MDGSLNLVIFSMVMLFGSYLAGSIPLFMSLSEEKLQLVSVLGAGLLLGTALSVIIPEGMQTLNMAYSINKEAHHHEGGEGEEEHQDNPVPHLIGVSLVLGFIFMLVIDQIATSKSRDIEVGGRKAPVSWTATLGLVVHAAADGVALGAAATTNQTDVEIIVFLAIMLHKAPASFGLVTYLMHEGLERSRIRRHLLVFSLAAPTMGILTFLSLTVHGRENLDTLSATGVAMLFSAGTFLYVATVHVLPEVTNLGHGHGGGGGDNGGGLTKSEMIVLIVGAIMPLFLTMGHHH
jgi:zinc transporter 9